VCVVWWWWWWWWEKRRRASPIPRSSQEGIGEEEKRFPPHQVYYPFFLFQVCPAHSACCNSAATYIPIHLAQEKFVWVKRKIIFFKKESTSERNTNTISESLLSYLSFLLLLLPSLAVGSSL
jgi:hypothetical protein